MERLINIAKPSQEEEDEDNTLSQSLVNNRSKQRALQTSLKNPNEPTISFLPNDVKKSADLVKISTILNENGLIEAKKRLALSHPEYKIDENLSNKEVLVVFDANGNSEIAFRGTNPKQDLKGGFNHPLMESVLDKGLKLVGLKKGTGSLKEWAVWGAIQSGKEDATQHFKEAEDIVIQARKKYNVKHLNGYSMGSSKAIKFGDKYSIPTTNFNAFLGENIMTGKPKSNVKHRIYRTTEDIASIRLLFNKSKLDLEIESILPIKRFETKPDKIKTSLKAELADALNPVKQHSLEHFTFEGDRQSFQDSMVDKVNALNTDRNYLRSQARNSKELANIDADYSREVIKISELLHQKPDYINPEIIKVGRGLGVINFAIGLAGGSSVEFVEKELGQGLDALGVDLPDSEEAQIALQAGVAEVATDYASAKLLKGNYLLGLKNIKSNILSAVVGAELENVINENLNNVFIDAGFDQKSSQITSSTISGGIGGGVSALTANYVLPILVNTTNILLESIGVASRIGSVLGPEGVVAGSIIGAVLGGIFTAVSVFNQGKTDIVLLPQSNQEADNVIGGDQEIISLLEEYSKLDMSPELEEELKSNINNRVNQLKLNGKIPENYDFEPNFTKLPAGILSEQNRGILSGNYDNIDQNIPLTEREQRIQKGKEIEAKQAELEQSGANLFEEAGGLTNPQEREVAPTDIFQLINQAQQNNSSIDQEVYQYYKQELQNTINQKHEPPQPKINKPIPPPFKPPPKN